MLANSHNHFMICKCIKSTCCAPQIYTMVCQLYLSDAGETFIFNKRKKGKRGLRFVGQVEIAEE